MCQIARRLIKEEQSKLLVSSKVGTVVLMARIGEKRNGGNIQARTSSPAQSTRDKLVKRQDDVIRRSRAASVTQCSHSVAAELSNRGMLGQINGQIGGSLNRRHEFNSRTEYSHLSKNGD